MTRNFKSRADGSSFAFLHPATMPTTATPTAARCTNQTALPLRFADHTVLEAPPLTQVYISDASGLGIHGLLKAISRDSIQVLTPIPVPVRSAVLITIAGCCQVRAEVFYCVKKSTVFQVGIVFSTRYKPEVAVGSFAVVYSLEPPFKVARGHVMDVGRSSLSILCKTNLSSNTWVRVESNGWVLFGEVEGVVVSSMLASCVGIHLDAAFSVELEARAPSLHVPSGETHGRAGRSEA